MTRITSIKSSNPADYPPGVVNDMLLVQDATGKRPIGLRIAKTAVRAPITTATIRRSRPGDCLKCVLATGIEENDKVIWQSVMKSRTRIARQYKDGVWLEEYETPAAERRTIETFDQPELFKDDDARVKALSAALPKHALFKPRRLSQFTPVKNERRRGIPQTVPGKGTGGARDTHRKNILSRTSPRAASKWA